MTWAGCGTPLEGCSRKRRVPESHRLEAAVSLAARVLPRYQRPRLWPRAALVRRLTHTLGVLFVLSCRVRELCMRCLGGALIFGRCRNGSMCGSWLLSRDTDCVWCASQARPRPHTRMVSSAVHASCGAPCGGVLGGDSHELPSSPQNFRESKRCISVILIHPSNYLIGRKYFLNVEISRYLHVCSR